MAWNEYRNIRRKVGCQLRVSTLPTQITACAPTGHEISSVHVEMRTFDDEGRRRATLAIWSYAPGTHTPSCAIESGRFNTYTVTMVNVLEDPAWIIECD